MFCRFCGRKILDDSSFCPYCGKFLSERTTLNNEKTESKTNRNQSSAKKTAGKKLRSISKIFCYIALGIFLILYIKMAPDFSLIKFLAYIIGAAIAIGLTIFYQKKSLTCKSSLFYRTALIIAISVILLSAGLRITYEAKLNSVLNDMPPNGKVYLRLKTDEEFYSYLRKGAVWDSSTNIKIGDVWCESGDIIYIELNETYSLKINCGHIGSSGSADDSIEFTLDTLRNDYILTKRVELGISEYAEVTLTFKRVCDFWEVILY